MTKKDYILIAKTFKDYFDTYGRQRDIITRQDMELVINVLAGKMFLQKSRFNKDKFLLACGITE